VNGKKSSIHFLVHESGDTVAVATVDLEAGAEAQGLTMDTHSRVEVRVLEDIPLGHKIALQDHKAGAGVITYGHGRWLPTSKKARTSTCTI